MGHDQIHFSLERRRFEIVMERTTHDLHLRHSLYNPPTFLPLNPHLDLFPNSLKLFLLSPSHLLSKTSPPINPHDNLPHSNHSTPLSPRPSSNSFNRPIRPTLSPKIHQPPLHPPYHHSRRRWSNLLIHTPKPPLPFSPRRNPSTPNPPLNPFTNHSIFPPRTLDISPLIRNYRTPTLFSRTLDHYPD